MKTNKNTVIPPFQVFLTMQGKKKKKEDNVSEERSMYAMGEAESQGPLTQNVVQNGKVKQKLV